MKKLFYFTLFLLTSNLSFSQVSHIKVLIGDTESEVTQYLDSLNSLKQNPYYKIERDVNNNGDLLFKNAFALADESFYTCSDMGIVFTRVKGTNVCIREWFMGSVQYASSNMDYVKDHFRYVSPNDWELPYENGAPYKIVATFERIEGKYPKYSIMYDLQPIK